MQVFNNPALPRFGLKKIGKGVCQSDPNDPQKYEGTVFEIEPTDSLQRLKELHFMFAALPVGTTFLVADNAKHSELAQQSYYSVILNESGRKGDFNWYTEDVKFIIDAEVKADLDRNLNPA